MARPLHHRAIDWSVNDYPGSVAEDPTSSSEPGLSSQWDACKTRFVIVLVVVLVGAVIGAVWAAFGTAEVYRQIGRGGLSLNDGTDRPASEPTAAVAAGEREAEIRQMLEARNARRAARGQAPADVEAELAELLAEPGATDGRSGAGERGPRPRHRPQRAARAGGQGAAGRRGGSGTPAARAELSARARLPTIRRFL